MGRKATVNLNLPKGMRARKRETRKGTTIWYYYDTGSKPRKEIPLGNDYIIACQKWANLSLQKLKKCHEVTFVQCLQRFMLEENPKKAVKTQQGYKSSAKNLELFFGGENPATLDSIDTEHIREYMRWRKNAPIAANRELALFNSIWTFCGLAHWGYTSKTSPAHGIKKNKEQPRDVYVEDFIYNIIYECASQDLQDAMDVALMLGQRPGDVLKIHTDHIQKEILTIVQNKTRNNVRFMITGRVQEIINRRAPDGGYLFRNKLNGKMSTESLWHRFNAARKLAIEKHPEYAKEIAQVQYRDLRAKAATDKSLESSEEEASKLLGHSSVKMTQKVYIRRTPVIKPFEPNNS